MLSCTSAEVCGFIYVAFILCMKKHSSGIEFHMLDSSFFFLLLLFLIFPCFFGDESSFRFHPALSQLSYGCVQGADIPAKHRWW